MFKRPFNLILMFCIIKLLVVGSFSAEKSTESDISVSLTILYSNDILGYLTPCG